MSHFIITISKHSKKIPLQVVSDETDLYPVCMDHGRLLVNKHNETFIS